MKKVLNSFQMVGFAFTFLMGSVLHFLYDWLNQSPWVAPFSAVNESTWEHMKLLFWPMLIFGIIQFFFFRKDKRYWCIKLRGMLLGLMLIPVLFYTYNGVIFQSSDWVNVLIFAISAVCAYLYERHLFLSEKFECKRPGFALILLALLAICFVVFTFNAPTLNLFRDPLSGTYGI